MNLIQEHNKKYEFFRKITGTAMKVYNKYRPGLLEGAYEAAMKYLLEVDGFKVERQVFLPIFWDDVQLDQTYRMDLVVNDDIIVELKDKVATLGISPTAAETSDDAAPALNQQVHDDAVEALRALGYPPAPVAKVVRAILKDDPEATVERVIKMAFKML